MTELHSSILSIVLALSFINTVTAYFRGPELLSWNAAEAYCQSQGSHLASIQDATENSEAFSVCEAGGNSVCWIGSNNNVATWTDGSVPSGFTYWQDPAPRAQYPYVLLWYGGWAGASEEWTQYPLCNDVVTSSAPTTDPTTSAPTSDPSPAPTKDPTSGEISTEYFRGPELLSWSAAEAYCQSLGSNLASIHDATDNSEAFRVCEAGGNNVCWIGSNNNVASWTDGTAPSGFTDWQSPAPRAQYPYVLLWYGGWAGGPESWTQYPLCNVVPVPTSAPTSDPSVAPTSDPSVATTLDPSVSPTTDPSLSPTLDPSQAPTSDPSQAPTTDPTTSAPTKDPTSGEISTEYFRGPELLSWSAAETYCQSLGSNLASIHDATGNSEAFRVCEAGGNNVCWIGSNNNVASWTDGSVPSGFTDWQSPAPRAQYPYVLLWYGGWAGGPESWTQYPLCNFVPAPSSAPTTDPSQAPSADPSVSPTTDPSLSPTSDPSVAPSSEPSQATTTDPTDTISTAYFRGPELLTWSAAEAYCQSLGSNLASIQDATDNSDAFSVCEAGGNSVCWIGSNNNVASWTDGTAPSGFTDWQSPAPRAQYPYVLLWFGGWAGGPESWTQYPLCNAISAPTTDPSQAPTLDPSVSPTTDPSQGPTTEPTTPDIISTAYFRGPELLTWSAAEAYCQSLGSNLASIQDATDNSDAFSVCEAGGNSVCWIGSNNNVATWTDGTAPSGFTDWQSPAPRAQYPYVLLWFGGWAGGPESWTQYPLCNAVSAATTDPSQAPTSDSSQAPTTDPSQAPTTEPTASDTISTAYFRGPELLTWSAAEAYCQSLGSNLASIQDATENSEAFNVCEAGDNTVCWIGSNNNVASWTDGSAPSGFTDWQSPAPRAQYPCVLLWFGGWAGGPCEEWSQYPLCNAVSETATASPTLDDIYSTTTVIINDVQSTNDAISDTRDTTTAGAEALCVNHSGCNGFGVDEVCCPAIDGTVLECCTLSNVANISSIMMSVTMCCMLWAFMQ